MLHGGRAYTVRVGSRHLPCHTGALGCIAGGWLGAQSCLLNLVQPDLATGAACGVGLPPAVVSCLCPWRLHLAETRTSSGYAGAVGGARGGYTGRVAAAFGGNGWCSSAGAGGGGELPSPRYALTWGLCSGGPDLGLSRIGALAPGGCGLGGARRWLDVSPRGHGGLWWHCSGSSGRRWGTATTVVWRRHDPGRWHRRVAHI